MMSKRNERSDFPIITLLPADYAPSPPAKKDYGIGADNLNTIRIVDAAVRSSTRGRAVELR